MAGGAKPIDRQRWYADDAYRDQIDREDRERRNAEAATENGPRADDDGLSASARDWIEKLTNAAIVYQQNRQHRADPATVREFAVAQSEAERNWKKATQPSGSLDDDWSPFYRRSPLYRRSKRPKREKTQKELEEETKRFIEFAAAISGIDGEKRFRPVHQHGETVYVDQDREQRPKEAERGTTRQRQRARERDFG